MTTSSLRRWAPILVVACLSASPVRAQIVPARNADAKSGFVFRVGRGRVGAVGIAQFDGVVIICQPAAQPVAADGDAPFECDPQPPRVQVTFSQGSLDQLIFGQEGDATVARRRFTQLLDRRIKAVDRTCQLTESQIEKLQLAGRGDLKRLLDRADGIRARFGNVEGIGDVDQFQKWATDLSSEIEALRPVLNKDPFDGNSLFFKTLKKTLNPEQAAEFKRTPAERLVAARGAARPISLEDILRGWERAASRRGRLDCRFTRIQYDPNFKIEHRGRGSLAVDRMGRAAYEIGPTTIEPGAVGQKKGPGGDPYELKADQPERWHWTGSSIIRVDEAARTFEEWKLPAKPRDGEFHPDPAELPEDSPPPKGAVPARQPRAIPTEPVSPRDKPTTVSERIAGLVFGIILTQALAKIDFSAILEAMNEFPIARPFLLGMPADELRQRFDVKLINTTETEIWLRFEPSEKKDQAWLRNAMLILSSEDYLPKALRVVDAAGVETVHVFSNVSVMAIKEGAVDALPRGTEPLDRPNLNGYTEARDPRP